MNEDLGNKIKQIAEMLDGQTTPDNLKNLLSMLTNSSKHDTLVDKDENDVPIEQNKQQNIELEDTLKMVSKMRGALSKVSGTNDPRINLLTAIKPFLNATRQQKVGSCIKLLQMTQLTTLFDGKEQNGF